MKSDMVKQALQYDGPPPSFEVSNALYQEMIAHVRAEAPNEGCGLVAFAKDRPVRVFPGTNTERSTTRFQMDWKEVVAAQSEMERQGWWLGAIFHSHPRSEAAPSRTDLRNAFYPDALMVIISLVTDPPDVRAYQANTEAYQQVPIRITHHRRERQRWRWVRLAHRRGRARSHGR